ncbi:Retrovirus-related Pol polyprotein from transposon TNT 1-94 [Vitis vinifera]|uniref:Retrovirus-related Pol polyprotein from transposon TNT 1-94 n=1 Tax=Vitis vinifera TaxID=29760 RepID=A0A438D8F1_VITVI|nr:Retrovirus-related Pol polyprotein from transposon TNT 1-94 [Vitis vinifera]
MMSLKYQDVTPMTDHLNTFQGIINQLAGINIKFEEEVQGLWLLGTLLDSWETFRTSLSNSSPDVTEKRGKSKSRGPKNRDRSKSKTNKISNVECHYCHLKGHIKKYCRQLKRDMKKGKVKEKKNDNGGEDDQVATTTSDFFIVYDSDVVNFACQETSWVIDNGASIHATPRKDFFTSYTSDDFGSVRMGNDGSAKAIGMGDLDDEGFYNTFRDSQWKLTRGSMAIAKGNKSSSLYLMQARVIDSSINAVDDDSTFELWHNRLGHMSEKGLMILAKKNLLSSMKKGSLKRQSGEKLKCIRTDNGGEYSGPFDEYCRQHGIRHQKTPPKTPQLNGLAERMNRTLVERVRCLLSQSQLPRSFWGEALNTVVHVLNLTPCVPLEFDVPDRIWSNNEISYDHLRVFGCKAFVHIPKDERSKLDAKTRPCVFIGYGQDELGYRFYDSVQKKLVEDEAHDDQHDMGDVETPTQVEDEAHDDQHDMGDVETPTQVEVDDDVHEQSPTVEAPSNIPLRKSTRDRHPSTRYSVDDYVLLTDGGEPESYVEAMEDENKMKWVYKVKQEEHTSQPRYKARLVVKGFNQKKSSLDLEIQRMDVKTAFLHGDLDTEIYMEQLEGFVLKGKEDYVCKLKKSLYGLKQAPRQNVSRIDNLKKQLSKSFAMKDLGPAKRILGIKIERDRASKKLCMLQEQYIEKVLARFNMSKAKVVSSPLASHFKLSSRHSPSIDKEKEDMRRVPYASTVGSLMYAMEVVKWIMRYLRGTSKLKLTFRGGKPILVGYIDSDMAGDVDNRRSTSDYLMTFSGGVVSWQSRLKKCVALSTIEAKYIAAAEACKELLWMKCFMQELGFKQQRYVVYCDNQSAIHLSKNSTYQARSKHIDVRYHWMRDALNDNFFEIEKIHTDNNGSDMLTKTLPMEKLGVCCFIAGMISSNGRSYFVCGPIDLKFEGEIFNSLISNLNGGDRIWSSGRFSQEGIKSGCALFAFIPSSSSLDLSFEDDSVADEKIPFLAYLASVLKGSSIFLYESHRNEEYVESGLDELELWYGQTKEECVDSSWDELKHIRQVDWILGHSPKDDNYSTRSIPPNVISSTWVLMPEDSNDTTSDSRDAASSTFASACIKPSEALEEDEGIVLKDLGSKWKPSEGIVLKDLGSKWKPSDRSMLLMP